MTRMLELTAVFLLSFATGAASGQSLFAIILAAIVLSNFPFRSRSAGSENIAILVVFQS